MKITPKFLIQIFLSLLVLSPAVIYISISYFLITNSPDHHEPWVSFLGNPSEEVYISWETEDESIGRISYGIIPDNLNMVSDYESEETKIHHVILSGLQPNTKYYYQAESGDYLSRISSFYTAPIESIDFSWAMLSDTQQPKIAPGHHARLADLMKDKNYRFVANVGDLVDEGTDKNHWNNFFNAASPYTQSSVFIPVAGNHERTRKTDSYFFDYFINSVSNSDREFFWSYRYGQVHFTICNFLYAREEDFNQEQIDWIVEDLTNAQDATFRVVMFHSPIIGSGYFGRNDNLLGFNDNIGVNITQILIDYNVSVTVHGHEHSYQRAHIGDMVHLVLGGGGGALDPGSRAQPETQITTPTPSYTEVNATANILSFRTIGIGGYLIDEFVIFADGGVN